MTQRRLSHLGPEGGPRMVDVSDKPVTARVARAGATVRFDRQVLQALEVTGGPKGDAFVTARLAGIAAAKRTPDLIPLCHPIPLDRVDIEPVGGDSPNPGISTVITSRCRVNCCITGSQPCRRCPAPCSRTSGGPVPDRS